MSEPSSFVKQLKVWQRSVKYPTNQMTDDGIIKVNSNCYEKLTVVYGLMNYTDLGSTADVSLILTVPITKADPLPLEILISPSLL